VADVGDQSDERGSELLDAARRFRIKHPEPLTALALQKGISEELGNKPSVSKLRAALLQASDEFTGWVTDLTDSIQHRSGNDLLSAWIAADVHAQGSLAAELEAALQADTGHSEVASIARALGAIPGPTDWSAISVHPPVADWIPGLVEAARSQSQLAWLFDAAAYGSLPLSKAAVAVLKESDPGEVDNALIDRLVTWPREPTRSAALRKNLERLLRQFGGSVSPEVGSTAVKVAAATPKEGWVPTYVGAATNVADPASLDRAVLELEVSDLVGLLGSLRTEPAPAQSPRARLLVSAARRDPNLVTQKDIWGGMAPAEVAWVVDQVADPEGLVAQLSDTVIGPLVRSVTRSMRPAELFSLAANCPRLLPFIEPSIAAAAAQRSDPAAVLLQRAFDHHSAAHVSVAATLEAEVERGRAQLADSRAHLEQLRADFDRSTEECQRLRKHIAETTSSERSLLDAQLRQGRLDIIKALIDVAERLRDMMAAEAPSISLIGELHGDVVRELSRFGVSIIGDAGSQRAFDPLLDRNLGADAETVEVISPAYVAGPEGVDVTVLRHASVRGVQPSDGE
jgi:hypothetical protein